ncbi:hypothetical protein BD309DRAFT_956151 [Dichomitus squalens]|nr:hypothetical protein BD309DRAFT_956151 [Dichomitus squalens]
MFVFRSIAPLMTTFYVHGNPAGAHSVLSGLTLDGLRWPALYMSTGQRRRCGIVLPLLQIPCSRNAAYKAGVTGIEQNVITLTVFAEPIEVPAEQ